MPAMPAGPAGSPLVSDPAGGHVRLTAWLHGRVQAVGMRWWIRSQALELGLAGWARNTEDGRVEVVAEGLRDDAERLLHRLREGPGRPGHVTTVTDRWSQARGEMSGFVER
jgi:acylphosphatase